MAEVRMPVRILVPYGRPKQFSLYIKNRLGGEMDFTRHLYTGWNVSKSRNKVSSFNATLMAVSLQDKIDFLVEGSVFKFFCENKLLLKGKITNVSFDSYDKTEITGYCMGIDLQKTSTTRVSYLNNLASSVCSELNNKFHNVNNYAYDKYVSVDVEYDNRLNGITNVVQMTNDDWWITQPDYPYEVDYFYVGSRGGSISVYTFDISANKSAVVIGREKDDYSVFNDLVLLGVGDGTNQKFSRFSRYTPDSLTGVRAYMYLGDAFLLEDVSISSTEFQADNITGFPSSGTLMIGKEQVTYTGISNKTFTGCTRGANGTTAVEHWSGNSIMGVTRIEVKGLTARPVFPAKGKVKIGMEVISYDSTADGSEDYTVYLQTLVRGANDKEDKATSAYSHERWIECNVYDDGVESYDYDKPYTGSRIQVEELKSVQITDRSLYYQNSLDRAAQRLVSDFETSIDRINVVSFNPFPILDVVDIGSIVTLVDTNADINGDYRVRAYSLSFTNQGYNLVLEVANRQRSVEEALADNINSVGTSNRYSQGVTATSQVSVYDNCDADSHLNMRFYVPPDCERINKVLLSFKIKPFRMGNVINHGGYIYNANNRGTATPDSWVTVDTFVTPDRWIGCGVFCSSVRNDNTTASIQTNLRLVFNGSYFPSESGVPSVGVVQGEHETEPLVFLNNIPPNSSVQVQVYFTGGDSPPAASTLSSLTFYELKQEVLEVPSMGNNVAVYAGLDGFESFVGMFIDDGGVDISGQITNNGWNNVRFVSNSAVRIEANLFLKYYTGSE